MLEGACDEPIPKTATAMAFGDVDVAEPRECRAIRHHTREAHLLRTLEHAEAQRPLDSLLEHPPGDALTPIRLAIEEIEDRVEVEGFLIGRDREPVSSPSEYHSGRFHTAECLDLQPTPLWWERSRFISTATVSPGREHRLGRLGS